MGEEMTIAFDSVGASPLGAFLRSALDARKGAGGRVKLIGNVPRNELQRLSEANESIYIVCAVNSNDPATLWTLQVSKDLDILWQRKHAGFFGSILGYAATPSHTFLVAQKSGIGSVLFIQSAIDGSTISASLNLGTVRVAKAGADSIIISRVANDTSSISPGNSIQYFAEISSALSILNEFVIGKSGQVDSIQIGVFLVDGADVYLGASNNVTLVVTILKTTHAGAIAWQKKVGTSSPPVIAANGASSRVYVGSGRDIIALNSIDGSFVWGKKIINVAQVVTITIETFDAATTHNVTIHLAVGGDRSTSQVGTTDATTTATNLKDKLNALNATIITLREITWTSAANVITGTANIAGIGFTITTSVSGGVGTISNATPTPNNTGVGNPIGHLADEEGIFATYSADAEGNQVLLKLDALDGSELYARRISPRAFRIAGLVDDGARLLLATFANVGAEGFGESDIIVGACASNQATDFPRVYQDLTPTVTDETYQSASVAQQSFTPSTFDNQPGDLSIKDFEIADFPEDVPES